MAGKEKSRERWKYARGIDIKYNVKVLWSFLKNYKIYVYGLIIITFLIELTVFFDNFLFKYLIDKSTLFVQEEITSAVFGKIILLSVLVFLCVKLIEVIFWATKIRFINRLDGLVMSDVEKRSFWHIMTLSYRFHSNRRTGSIISKFTRGVSKVENFVDAFVFHFFPVVFRLILSIGIIIYFDLATAIALAIMAALFIIIGITIANIQKIPQSIANYREDILKQNLSDVFLNIETVKYFAQEKRTFSNFSSLSRLLREARINFWNYFSWSAGLETAVLGLGIGAIFYISFTGLMDGRMTLGTITLIYAAVWKLIPVLFGLMHGYREYIRSSVDVDALFAIFKEENEVKDVKKPKILDIKDGEVEFKGVSFSYPGKRTRLRKEAVLQDFSLKIRKNSKVALVGPSGGGKTTIIKLLYRLFDVGKGKILIDGKDISGVTQESLRGSMSIVPQEPLLFDNTIYFNIAYANPNATKKDVWRAIRFAQLDKFIRKLPNGENTLVGERGVKLSGGEKQRVSIARALLADKKILVLDEATSSLDSKTEKDIQGYLAKLMKERTSIIIAHRLSTIMKADVIVVVDKGRIIETGTHKELRNNEGGLYRKLWELQVEGNL